MAEKLHRLDDEQMIFFCPGCKCEHGVRIGGKGHPLWLWNGSMESPTFSPSINFVGVCHSFVINGTIQFLLGSSHSLSGRTVEIPDWELSPNYFMCTQYSRAILAKVDWQRWQLWRSADFDQSKPCRVNQFVNRA
jgi:hypothetical protein